MLWSDYIKIAIAAVQISSQTKVQKKADCKRKSPLFTLLCPFTKFTPRKFTTKF